MIEMMKNNTGTNQPQPLIQRRFHVIRANSQRCSRFRHELSQIEQQLKEREIRQEIPGDQERKKGEKEEKEKRRTSGLVLVARDWKIAGPLLSFFPSLGRHS